MKQYRFNLESILTYRERIEGLLKEEFSVLQAAVRVEEEALEKLDAGVLRERALMVEKGEFTVPQLAIYNGYFSGVKAQVTECRLILAECVEKAEAKRLELVEATREKKVLENLKEKRHKEYKEASEKFDIKILDEHSVTKFAKQVNETK